MHCCLRAHGNTYATIECKFYCYCLCHQTCVLMMTVLSLGNKHIYTSNSTLRQVITTQLTAMQTTIHYCSHGNLWYINLYQMFDDYTCTHPNQRTGAFTQYCQISINMSNMSNIQVATYVAFQQSLELLQFILSIDNITSTKPLLLCTITYSILWY